MPEKSISDEKNMKMLDILGKEIWYAFLYRVGDSAGMTDERAGYDLHFILFFNHKFEISLADRTTEDVI